MAITEKTKLKLLEKSTSDLFEIRNFIDKELDHRDDEQINRTELEYGFNTIYRHMMKEGLV